MNKFRPFILVFTVIVSALLAFGLFTLPSPKSTDYEGFSSERVARDIEVISKAPHSVAQPLERAQVREYLIKRLQQIGADTIMVFRYDSLTGPQNKHVIYTFDAFNVLAEYAPLKSSEDTTYLMFVAHYDSRYSQPFVRDTVWSYGAADNGYGLGVTLETVSQLLKERGDWTQGVKVLFTDAEEVGKMGMSAIWENNHEVFEDVGFVINIEARGPWGPALLFEACSGNSNVMDLYASSARYPFTYSLTTFVYSLMPNFTDFTVVRDSIPGLNFSTIADINRYHTHLDNYGNISEKTIQHYGEQILPVSSKYLKSAEYSDVNALKSDKNAVNFTVPVLGIFNFSKASYLVFNVLVFVFFLLLFGLEGVRGRIKATNVFKKSCIVLISALSALVAGEVIAFISSIIAGVQFKPFGTMQGIMFDNVVMIVSMSVLTLVCVIVYLSGRSRSKRAVSGSMRASAYVAAVTRYAYDVLYGSLALLLVLNIALLVSIGETMMFIIPLFCATVAMILYHITNLRLWLPVAMALILIHAFSFYYALAMALTIGALGAVMMLVLFDIMVLIPLADLYIMPNRKK